METIIENVQQELPLKNRLFNTKEEYLAMRQAWRDFHNNGHAKAEWAETTHKVRDWRTNSVIEYTNKRTVSPLDGYHYMLYNLLRGLPSTRGFFDPKAEEGTEGWLNALRMLRFYIPMALPEEIEIPPFIARRGQEVIDDYLAQVEERRQRHLKMLTEPFGDTVTEEHLKQVLEVIQ